MNSKSTYDLLVGLGGPRSRLLSGVRSTHEPPSIKETRVSGIGAFIFLKVLTGYSRKPICRTLALATCLQICFFLFFFAGLRADLGELEGPEELEYIFWGDLIVYL